jgi:hypothetical protein
MDLPDFYLTGDDYRYRFEPEARQRFIDLIRERFNSGVKYKGRVLKWDTVIEQKATELGRFLSGKSSELQLATPSLSFVRHDDRELRARILRLTSSEAKRRGIGKSTLHYLRRNISQHRPFSIYTKVRAKLVTSAS